MLAGIQEFQLDISFLYTSWKALILFWRPKLQPKIIHSYDGSCLEVVGSRDKRLPDLAWDEAVVSEAHLWCSCPGYSGTPGAQSTAVWAVSCEDIMVMGLTFRASRVSSALRERQWPGPVSTLTPSRRLGCLKYGHWWSVVFTTRIRLDLFHLFKPN